MRTWIVVLVALGLSGCSDPATTTPESEFNVTGQVTDANGAGLSGIALALGGAKSDTATSDNNGSFSFKGLVDGSYTVTPSQTDATFDPPLKNFTVKGSHVGIKFSGSFSISGYVLDDTQQPIAGATVTLSGAASSTTTSEADGKYTFMGLANGEYSVSSNQSGYGFIQVGQTIVLAGSSANMINCIGTRPPPTTTYSISGRVVDSASAAVSGVTITLAGAQAATTTTNTTGDFTFAGLPSGAYMVTPTKPGSVFTPLSLAVPLATANASSINFTAATVTVPAPTYTLSGQVATINGTAVGGVTVTLSGASTGSVVTGANGMYTFAGLANGAYTVTPTLNGYTFNPPAGNVTVNNANAPAIDFVGTPPPPPVYTLSGRIVSSTGIALSGVAITAQSGAKTNSATSGTDGTYSFAGLIAGTYIVTPTMVGNTFAPSNQTIAVSGNVANINFIGTSTSSATYSISGRIADKSSVAAGGVTVALSGAATASATTDANGNFIFNGLSSGAYTLTPTLSGYSFAPTTLPITLSGVNITAADFVATPPPSGARNYSLFVTAGTLTVTGAGGAAIPAWSYTDVAGTPKFPGPLLTANEGDTVNITVTNNHTLSHNFVIKGITTDVTAIAPGTSKMYTFTATTAGTYLYYDSLNSDINRSLGLYGALIVRPSGGGNSAWTGGPAYTFERLWVTSDMDKPRWNDVASAGGTIDTAAYKPNYFLINGMGGRAAMDERIGTAIDGRVGQTALVRILNAGQFIQTLHFHANHVQVISMNGVRRTAPFKLLDVIQIPPLGSADVLFGLNQPGNYPMHNHSAQMETANGVYFNGVGTMIYIAP